MADSTPEKTVYSLQYLREGSDGDEEFMKTMIGMFLESTPLAINALQDSLGQADWETMRQTAHKLRSHLRYFAIIEAAELTEEIERIAAKNPEKQVLSVLVEKVISICQIGMRQLSEEFHL
ncbi:MAG TPA: Hpt domain-containing protein [Bacteroidales bacterium]|jgi:HPt (histidine-containing phosphotransfer) domain-containing protein